MKRKLEQAREARLQLADEHRRQMVQLLHRTIPMLIELGDHIGNGPIDPTREDSLGTRCDLIGDIKDVLGEQGILA